MECRNHSGTAASERCAACMEPFCANCLVFVKGRHYCASCKVVAVGDNMPIFESISEACAEANEALKFALIGIFCVGFVLEPLAIKKALDAKKIIAANPTLTGEGRANAALIIASVVFLLWIVGIFGKVMS